MLLDVSLSASYKKLTIWITVHVQESFILHSKASLQKGFLRQRCEFRILFVVSIQDRVTFCSDDITSMKHSISFHGLKPLYLLVQNFFESLNL